jgi:NAD(P)-dependent dehydrogenase (short-subunit alcohol dehydrogenase family)
MLRMGIDTHLITSAIAIPLLLRTGNGLIVEMTDGTFEYNVNFRKDVGFYYDMVKAAVGRIVIGLTAELKGESCTAVGVTQGWLRSEAMLQNFGVRESNWRDAVTRDPHFCISESPAYVARGIAELASDPNKGKWGGRILSSAELSKIYGITDVDGTRPDCWRYLVEVQDKGLPADDTGYR